MKSAWHEFWDSDKAPFVFGRLKWIKPKRKVCCSFNKNKEGGKRPTWAVARISFLWQTSSQSITYLPTINDNFRVKYKEATLMRIITALLPKVEVSKTQPDLQPIVSFFHSLNLPVVTTFDKDQFSFHKIYQGWLLQLLLGTTHLHWALVKPALSFVPRNPLLQLLHTFEEKSRVEGLLWQPATMRGFGTKEHPAQISKLPKI